MEEFVPPEGTTTQLCATQMMQVSDQEIVLSVR